MAFQQFTDPLKSLREMHRVLKNGGVAIINFNEEKSPFWIKNEEIIAKISNKNAVISATKKMKRKVFLELANNIGFAKIDAESREDTVYYKDADEVISSIQLSPKLDGDLTIKAKFDQEFRTYLNSIKTSQGIPETWHMVFTKLVK